MLVLLLLTLRAAAQQFAGMSGLLHTPSADMSTNESLRLGCTWVSRNFIPDYVGYVQDIPIYHVSVTPYRFVEASYLVNGWRNDKDQAIPDRNVCVKLRALEEGKWFPSLAIGGFDAFGNSVQSYYYAAATKHFAMGPCSLGLHVAYRKYARTSALITQKWNGLTGGITFNPGLYGDMRFTVEYTGNEFNAGFDMNLYRGLRAQGILVDGKWFCAGLSWEIHRL